MTGAGHESYRKLKGATRQSPKMRTASGMRSHSGFVVLLHAVT